jgi:hypothetical protein
MLRYDGAYPASSLGAAAIHDSIVGSVVLTPGSTARISVRLIESKPTEARWLSFGWIVKDVERT